VRRRNSGSRIGVALTIALLSSAASAASAAKLDGLRLIGAQAGTAEGDAYQRGRALLAINDLPGALAAFRQALTEHPQSLDTLNGIAVCYDRLGRYDLSRTYYETALAIDPDAPVVLNNFGYSLYLQGNYPLAIDRLVAARNGPDPQASAAAARTLALIAAMPRSDDSELAAAPAAETAAAEISAASARIEQTSEGEQRLVFGTGPRSAAVQQVAVLGPSTPQAAVPAGNAAPTVAPVPGTALAAFRFDDAPRPAQVQVAAALIGDNRLRRPSEHRPAPALVPLTMRHREAAAVPPLAPGRRDDQQSVILAADGAALVVLHAAASTQPVLPGRAAAAFVSDDARLNAFAERMRDFGRGRESSAAGRAA